MREGEAAAVEKVILVFPFIFCTITNYLLLSKQKLFRASNFSKNAASYRRQKPISLDRKVNLGIVCYINNCVAGVSCDILYRLRNFLFGLFGTPLFSFTNKTILSRSVLLSAVGFDLPR